MQKSIKTLLLASVGVSAGTLAVAALVLFGGNKVAQAQAVAAPAADALDHRGPITGTMHMTGTKPFSGTHGMPGMMITETKVISVAPGSPADMAGIVAGDTIVKVDDADASPMALQKAVMDKAPGDQISLVVKDANNATRTLEVTLAENPDRAGVAYLGIEMGGRGGMGRRGPGGFGGWQPGGQGMPQMPRPPRGQRNQPSQPTQPAQPNQQTPGGRAPRGGFGQILPDGVDAGILIMNVTANSPAAAAGLTSRDLIVAVDGAAPTSVQAFVDAVGAKKAGEKITLRVYNPADQTSKDITVTLAENPSAKGKAYMGVTLNGRMIQRSTTQPQGTGA